MLNLRNLNALFCAMAPSWNEVNAAVFAVVKKFGGSISAEHAVGVMKRDLLPTVKNSVAPDLMRKIKGLLSPNNILNPGKVL
jgi:FAD/FMN-containing dehydrogenase